MLYKLIHRNLGLIRIRSVLPSFRGRLEMSPDIITVGLKISFLEMTFVKEGRVYNPCFE